MVIPIKRYQYEEGCGIEQKQSARDIAINYFLKEIKDGNLMSGDKILNERKLSDKLGISRVPLREAICTLSTLGILEAHQGDGTYVSENNTAIFSNIIKKYGVFHRSMADEVFEARCLFEADAAKLAAQNRTSQDLNRLKAALIQHENALPLYDDGEITAERMMEYDSEIHLGIAASAHNNFILQMIEAIRYVTLEQGFFAEQFTLNKLHFKESMVLHRKIVNAIESQDAEKAYQRMQEHIMQIQNALDLERIRRKENGNI